MSKCTTQFRFCEAYIPYNLVSVSASLPSIKSQEMNPEIKLLEKKKY